MNGPLHFYLADLVGNARQVTIETDNARIPIDGSDQERPVFGLFSDDASIYSSYTRHSNATISTADSSMSGSSNGSSRWDSEAFPGSPSLSKERRLRMPPRRADSDVEVTLSSPTSSSSSSLPKASPKMPVRRPASPVDLNKTADADSDCCLSFPSSTSSSIVKPLTLSSVAAQGMLRMPKRSESITRPEKRRSKGRIPSSSSKSASNEDSSSNNKGGERRRESSRSPRDSSGRRTRTTKKSTTKGERNVSKILGEAMRELGLTEDELTACADPTLPLQYLTEPKDARAA